MSVRHLPEIRRALDGYETTYQAVCTCGRRGQVHLVRSLAAQDVERHITALPPVPPEQQCRLPRQHDCRPWEACQLCANQLTLPGLEVIA